MNPSSHHKALSKADCVDSDSHASGTEALLQRLRWRSRRGMLELDLLLGDFAREVLPTLDRRDWTLYGRLIAAEDSQLIFWLQGGRDSDLDGELHSLVTRIRSWHAAHSAR